MRKRFIIVIFIFIIIISSIFLIAHSPNFKEYKVKLILKYSKTLEQIAFPYKIIELTQKNPDSVLVIPIQGLTHKNITNSWGAPRSNERSHEGIDIFAKKNTPIFSATDGYVIRTGTSTLGGNIIFVLGAGGVRYYYAHLDSIATGIEFGKEVNTDTVLGFVGNTGNAINTPPHLHFGMYKNGAQNPYDLLTARHEN